jgi:hypothetical protein
MPYAMVLSEGAVRMSDRVVPLGRPEVMANHRLPPSLERNAIELPPARMVCGSPGQVAISCGCWLPVG